MPMICLGPCRRPGRALRRIVAVATLFAQSLLPTHAGFFDGESTSPANDGGSILDPAIGSAPSAPAVCRPSAGGATCDGAGPASQEGGAGGALDVGAGNPIDVLNGNKYQRETDLAPLPGVLGLEIVRHYNSAYADSGRASGLFGRGWRLSYETTLHVIRDTLQIVQADGRGLIFRREPDSGTRCASTDPADGYIETRTADDGTHYVWHWTHGAGAGRALGFDADGRLIQILAPSGEFVSLHYAPDGSLLRIVDPQERELRFRYARTPGQGAGRQVSQIDSPAGSFHYRYADATPATPGGRPEPLLTQVEREVAAGRVGREYHYEDARHPRHLTGITATTTARDGSRVARRENTWRYDEEGRGVFSMRGEPSESEDPETVRLVFERAAKDGARGITIVTDGTGGTLRHIHGLVGRQRRLLETLARPCHDCAELAIRHRYDEHGRLIESHRVDPAHERVVETRRFSFDTRGRLERIDLSTAGAAGERKSHFLRYEYEGELTRPTLLARPSVVPGREHRLALRYNMHGQPVELLETGYSPVDAEGRPVPGGVPLERTTRYTYRQARGRSLLQAFDGPLPNGPASTPADSDITFLTHDEAGNHLLALNRPMALLERLQRDALGRIVAATPADGVPIRLSLDEDGRPLRWQRGDAILEIARDGFGRPLRITLPDGEVRWFGHDGRQGLAAMVSSRGHGLWLQDGHSRPMAPLPQPAVGQAASARTPPPATSAAISDWAGLAHWRDDFGLLRARRTDATGLETFDYDAAGRLIERRFADGGVWRWQRDAAGRIVAHSVSRPGSPGAVTRLHYEGPHLVRIAHPHETETRIHDPLGRIATRRIARAGQYGRPDLGAFEYVERFRYDEADRVLAHELPEGGTLHYRWGSGRQLRGIDWVDPLRRRTPLIRSASPADALRAEAPGLPVSGGYRFGNGVEARWTIGADGRLSALQHHVIAPPAQQPLLSWLRVAHAAEAGLAGLIERWAYRYDPTGQMVAREDALRHRHSRFGFDLGGRFIAAEHAEQGATPQAEYYAYDRLGDTLGRRIDGRMDDFHRTLLERDAGGLPSRIGDYELAYGADRRPVEIRDRSGIAGASSPAPALLARYRHNAQGLRIQKEVFPRKTADGLAAEDTHFLWQGHQLVGEARGGRGAARLMRRYVYAHGTPVALLDYPSGRRLQERGRLARILSIGWNELLGRGTRIRYIHANEIGTPTAVTDDRARVIWRADHSVYGEARPVVGRTEPTTRRPFVLNLRLPGQYFDAETGWHDNVLRTYDPRRGQYLEPDPLGPHRLTTPFAYAAHNPLTHADPLGLILFAFDGTGNEEIPGKPVSNVVNFRELYDDGRTYYITGPGTVDPGTGIHNAVYKGGNPLDMAFSFTGKERVAAMVDYLDRHADGVEDELAFDIDIIGFSRGAAQARDFANQVAASYRDGYYRYASDDQFRCQRVNLRFIGLWDTVLSVHLGSYNLGIPDEFAHVAHAIALNEYRRLFPLESIAGMDTPDGKTRIERGFLGSHSDIGGSFEDGDLAKVALAWMVKEAESANVKMDVDALDRSISPQPVLHDKSRNLFAEEGPAPNEHSEDREVRYRDGGVALQREAHIDGMRYEDTTAFITYDNWPVRNVSGSVDMEAYLAWLTANDYGIEMILQ
ncbi:MAG: hypothetical protein GX576_04470 [Thauera phenolivorans]|uniref:DUF2235 domain-containing protein n=1 Tax=Thauera phenolivorans TaxID=1792543 RepID=A0A7X7LUW3_9RHOO|nr:hypothetical protein [Thauera phenolivorans]